MSGVMRTSVRSRRPWRMISWPAAWGMRWVNPSRATTSPSCTWAATASWRGVMVATPSAPRVPGWDVGVHVDPDRLRVGVAPHGLEAHLAPVSRLADAAEGRARAHALVAVHPHHAGAEGPGQPVGAGQVPGPEPGAEAVVGAVGHRDRVLVAGEGGHGDERPEHL